MMPRLNRVLEELGIHHEKHEVSPEVLATIEEKKRRATAKNATVTVKTKKRKGVAKKQKTSVATDASASSVASSASYSIWASANARGRRRRSSSHRRILVTAKGLQVRIMLSPPLPTHFLVFLAVTRPARTRREMLGVEVPILWMMQRLGRQAITAPWMLKSWRCQRMRWNHSLSPHSIVLAFSCSRVVGVGATNAEASVY
jgi:hypothetical protein